jgi:hypothetical protein
MKANIQTIYALQRSQQDCPSQSYYGNSQENKVGVHLVSRPTLTPAWWFRLEQHVENLGKFIQDQIEASPKETNNSEISYTRDNNIEPPIHSDTIEVQDLQVPTPFVQEEELIVEPTQQVFAAAHLDEVDKIGTMVFSMVEEKTVLFATLHPNIDFVIPDIFTDVLVPKALLLLVLPKVILAFNASSAQILILPHFKTRG